MANNAGKFVFKFDVSIFESDLSGQKFCINGKEMKTAKTAKRGVFPVTCPVSVMKPSPKQGIDAVAAAKLEYGSHLLIEESLHSSRP